MLDIGYQTPKDELVNVKVKARTSGSWQHDTESGFVDFVIDHLRWVFVDLADPDPSFSIVPDTIVKTHLAEKRRKSSIARTRGSRVTIDESLVDRWSNRWDLLTGSKLWPLLGGMTTGTS